MFFPKLSFFFPFLICQPTKTTPTTFFFIFFSWIYQNTLSYYILIAKLVFVGKTVASRQKLILYFKVYYMWTDNLWLQEQNTRRHLENASYFIFGNIRRQKAQMTSQLGPWSDLFKYFLFEEKAFHIPIATNLVIPPAKRDVFIFAF